MKYLIGLLFCLSLLAPASLHADPKPAPKMPDILAETRFQEPLGFRWGQFINARGQNIRWGALKPLDGAVKATIIVGPGYSEFAEKYFELARDLADKGFAVWIIDWIGQGGSARLSNDLQKMHGISPADAVSDLDQFITQIVDRQGPLIALGHSWGGNIMTRHMHDHPDRFQAAIFSSPTYWFAKKNGGPWLIKTLAYSAQMIGWGDHYAYGLRIPILPAMYSDH
jgi:alpha-beta hydrolase superfamily lysophospholipase